MYIPSIRWEHYIDEVFQNDKLSTKVRKMIETLSASGAPFQWRSRWGSWCCCSPPSWGDSLPVASWHSIINSVLLETFISGTISANILWQQITSPCPWTWLFGSWLPLKIMYGKHYSALLSPFHKKLIGNEVIIPHSQNIIDHWLLFSE